MNYQIIDKNLAKLEAATKEFPNILGKYKKTENVSERGQLKHMASLVGLKDYIQFYNWVESVKNSGQQIKYNFEISFDLLKTSVLEGLIDSEAKKYLAPKTKRGFISFLKSDKFSEFDGGYKRRRYRNFSQNFDKSKYIIYNYILQNALVDCFGILPKYYLSELPDFHVEIHTELEITKDITKSIIRKINSIKYDFRKLNIELLKSEIISKIQEKMRSVEPGEQIRCIEAAPGITFGKIYQVENYSINSDGNLDVTIKNDSGHSRLFRYRLFESLVKIRENSIDDILSYLDN